MIPSPADLTYFMEIAQTGNISRAAERLGISQPSLSLAVRRLEASVGGAVFTRSKRGVVLTRTGRQLLVHSRALLQSWDQVKAEALASISEVQGVYTIGCHQSVALTVLSRFLPGLMARYPRLDIKLSHDLSRKITEDVISSKIDIGIVVNPVRHPDLVIHRLCTDDVTLWTSGGEKSGAQDLTSGGAVLICDPSLGQSQALLKKFRADGLNFGRVIYSGSLEVIADLVAGGCGIGILPGQVAGLARKTLVRVRKAPVIRDEHCLAFRVENKGVIAIQVLSKAIRDSF